MDQKLPDGTEHQAGADNRGEDAPSPANTENRSGLERRDELPDHCGGLRVRIERAELEFGPALVDGSAGGGGKGMAPGRGGGRNRGIRERGSGGGERRWASEEVTTGKDEDQEEEGSEQKADFHK